MDLFDWNRWIALLTSSLEAPCATSAVVAMSAAIMAGSISSSPSPDIIFSMIWNVQKHIWEHLKSFNKLIPHGFDFLLGHEIAGKTGSKMKENSAFIYTYELLNGVKQPPRLG